MSSLAQRHCKPAAGHADRLRGAALKSLLMEIPGWKLVGGKRIVREFRFPDFSAALAFVNAAGAVAECENHHPDLFLSWGLVRVEISTHRVGGLTECDFILAARISRMAK